MNSLPNLEPACYSMSGSNCCFLTCIQISQEAVKVKWRESLSVVSNSLRPQGLYSPWNSLGQNTGVGSLSVLQGIYPTQGSNPGLPHCRQILYQLSHKRSPRIMEWVAYYFSSASSQPRNWTRVSCIAGGFFTSWTTNAKPQKSFLLRWSFLNYNFQIICR